MTERVGVKDDVGKVELDLVPPGALEAVARVFTFGARKYAPHGWRTVDNGVSRYWKAGLRHVLAHWRGERLDLESGESHLAHAIACFAIVLELQKETPP